MPAHRAIPCLIALTALACGGGFGSFDSASVVDADIPYATGRCSADTQLMWEEPSPQQPSGRQVPKDVEVVRYPADPGELRGYLMRPQGADPARALVYLHSGFAWEPPIAEDVRGLVAAGWVVFMPTVRGENYNPGRYELLCGEVDDAAAAVRWLAQQPYVDPARIAAFGHSAGGGLSAMLSLVPDLPLVTTGSAGGLYFEELLQGWGPMSPFDPNDATERRRRLLVAHLGQMQRPHRAYLGKDDALVAIAEPAKARAAELGVPLEVTLIEGDHHSSKRAALEGFTEALGW